MPGRHIEGQCKYFNIFTWLLIGAFLCCCLPIMDLRYAPSKAYFIENDNFLIWLDAKNVCLEKGMHLFSIDNEEDFNFLKNFIQEKYQRLLPYWTGAFKVNGTFYWNATGESIAYIPWHENEPNNSSGNETCIHTWENHFDWNDNDCIVKLPFICEQRL